MTHTPMTPEEAARLAISEWRDNPSLIGNLCVGGNDEMEALILRAFALAGYGWRPIEEARKDGTRYLFFRDGELQFGGWTSPPSGRAGWWYTDNRGSFKPSVFHELPMPPNND